MTSLTDLVAIRVMVFPTALLLQVHALLREQFPEWTLDAEFVASHGGRAFKYHGPSGVSPALTGEIQIVPMLLGLFWQIEHSAVYKSSPRLRGVERSQDMIDLSNDVVRALRAFEDGFERVIDQDPLQSP